MWRIVELRQPNAYYGIYCGVQLMYTADRDTDLDRIKRIIKKLNGGG